MTESEPVPYVAWVRQDSGQPWQKLCEGRSWQECFDKMLNHEERPLWKDKLVSPKGRDPNRRMT